MTGAQRNSVPREIANKIFEQLSAFGSFSFAKSHAASFALITYWHAWLRTYHKAAFFCGILRNEPASSCYTQTPTARTCCRFWRRKTRSAWDWRR